MKKVVYVLVLFLILAVSCPEIIYARKFQNKNEVLAWLQKKYVSAKFEQDYIRVKSRNYCGIYDTMGVCIVPCNNFWFIREKDNGYFVLCGHYYETVCDSRGNILIPYPVYNYAFVHEAGDDDVYFKVEMQGKDKEGAYNKYGKEVIPLRDNQDIYYSNSRSQFIVNHEETGIGLYGKVTVKVDKSNELTASSAASSGIYSNSSSQESSTESEKNEPIAKGVYNIHIDPFPIEAEVKFYKKYITVLGKPYSFDHVEGIYSIYSGSDGCGGRLLYYVDFDYNMKQVQEMWSPYGVGYHTTSMTRQGEVYIPGQSNSSNYSNSSYSAPTTSGSSSSGWKTVTKTETCQHCWGSGKCPTCNGKQWYYNPYNGEKVSCPNCHDGKCSFCGGTGKITKTETVRE